MKYLSLHISFFFVLELYPCVKGGQHPWSSLVERDEGCISRNGNLLCLWQTEKIYATHAWRNSIVV